MRDREKCPKCGAPMVRDLTGPDPAIMFQCYTRVWNSGTIQQGGDCQAREFSQTLVENTTLRAQLAAKDSALAFANEVAGKALTGVRQWLEVLHAKDAAIKECVEAMKGAREEMLHECHMEIRMERTGDPIFALNECIAKYEVPT